MAVRDLSGSSWVSPGSARLDLNAILTALSLDPQELDSFISSFSPCASYTVNWTTGANTWTLTDTTNSRFVLVLLPYGNTQTCILSWKTGDTVSYINPAGFWLTTLDPNHMPATLYATVGGNISGVRILVF